MKFQIKDFVDMHAIDVEALQFNSQQLVVIAQSGGSMRFQHTMTTDQARYMAAALQMAAEQAESMTPEQVTA